MGVRGRGPAALLLVAAVGLLLPLGAAAAPAGGPLGDLAGELQRFQEAARSYRSTVNGIVKRAFQSRRRGLLASYDKKIRREEKEERARRVAAITLFEDFLRRYPNDRRWTPDVIFRLAELYFEKSNDAYLSATEAYEQQLKLFDQKKLAKAPTPPRQDYSQTIALHRRLIGEWPRYRLVDGAYYLLGFCMSEMGELDRGNQAFLALVCSNRYKPPLRDAEEKPRAEGAPAPLVTARPMPGRMDTGVYDACEPLRPRGRFNAEAWIRIGEYHFDENQLGPAIAAYRRVIQLGVKGNPYYDEALYKLAWTYYRADDFTRGIENFDKLVVFSDKDYERTGRAGSEMRPEAVQYLAISFAEEDWDGDTLPDKETGIQRIEKFYAGRWKEKHVYEVYRRLADIYFDTTKYEDAVKVYRIALKRWPYRADNPEIQEKIITALNRQRKFDEEIDAREEFTRLFGKGTEWERRNRNNPKALRKAREIDEQALIQAAVFHHRAGQEFKKKGLALRGDPATAAKALSLLDRAAKEYALAAKAYQRYLDRFPNTKNSYEIRYSYATALYYSGRLLDAARAFAAVRDSNLDNRYLEESAFSAAKSWEQLVEQQVKEGKLPKPPMPSGSNPPASLEPMALPEPYAKWQEALDLYRKLLPKSPKTPRLTYKAAEIDYRFVRFKEARARFEEIYEKYCDDPMATTAAQAILVSYQLEKNLDQTEAWAAKLKSGKCGAGSDKARELAEKAGGLIEGIRFKRAQKLFAEEKWDAAARAFLALVDANPKSEDAPKALNNAAVAYEKSKRFESATKLYERIWQEYPKSELAANALWRAALNYRRFFAFRKAVSNFEILADSPRFRDSPNRMQAILYAAEILEYDQDYPKAARLFLRYAREVSDAKKAADAFFRAGEIYEKMGDYPAMVKIFREFPRLYGSVSGQEQRAVEAYYRIGRAAAKRGDWRTAQKYYRLAMSEFSARGLQPATPAALFAAEAAFRLAERRLQDFLKTKIGGPPKRLLALEKKLAVRAKRLKQEYESIWGYKHVTWTLAAMYRSGTIFEHLARVVAAGWRESPIPKRVRRLGQEAIDIYQGQLDQLLDERVRPLEEKAKGLYEACVRKARELKISTPHTEACLRRLNAFDPLAYPLMKKPKIEQVLE